MKQAAKHVANIVNSNNQHQTLTSGASTGVSTGVSTGKIASIQNRHQVSVNVNNSSHQYPARLVESISWHQLLNAEAKQLDVLLVFENGNIDKPIIIDILTQGPENQAQTQLLTPDPSTFTEADNQELHEVDIDGERLTFNAKEQITLKCGKASITLTKSGKIMLKGAYVLNRSSGALRLKGGSVQIN